MSNYDVAIIGAGPAGMMAAITASGKGKRVVLVDRNPQLGRKLLATGNGRCNLTNSHVTIDRFHGGDLKLIESVLSQFDQPATLEFFLDLGLVVTEEDDGRIFPRTNQASSVVELLKQRLVRNHVEILLDAQVTGIRESWIISRADGKTLQADKLIIATGGRAAHYLGSTGDGLYWAQQLGHSLTPIYAALVPIETVEEWPKDAQGIKVEAAVCAASGNRKISESSGDLLFTAYGVSGPAAMALSGSIAPLLKTSDVLLHIDLFPDMTIEQLDQILVRVFSNDGNKTASEALIGLLPSGLIPIVIKLAGASESEKIAAMPKARRLNIVRTLKDTTLTVSKLRPPKEAQVTAGGISSEEVDPRTLQSRLVKGLYFAGEMLDVDGDSGGFNLQWAWSSGRVAGMPAD
jgi:predicted Rossmann fold flavoprotein